MSEFRIFCIAFWLGAALLAAGVNHGLAHDAVGSDRAESLFVFASFIGCIAVALFGKRRDA